MKNEIELTVSQLREFWTQLPGGSAGQIKSALQNLAKDPAVNHKLLSTTLNLPKGLELHRDQKEGFILLAYSEERGMYRAPHDHGRAWVVYAVASGTVEMGGYFNAVGPEGRSRLIQKGREVLTPGDARIYYPGEIHDTRCISDHALILRLTSLDLKEEERAGHMHRYPLLGESK